jgi:hypothetical protein
MYHLLSKGTGLPLGEMYRLLREGTGLLLRGIYHILRERTCLPLLGGKYHLLQEGTGLHLHGGMYHLLQEGAGLHLHGGMYHLLQEVMGLLLLGGNYHRPQGGTGLLPQNADLQLAGIFLHLQKGGDMTDHGLLLEGAVFLLATEEEVIGIDLSQGLLRGTIIEDRLGANIRPGADILPDEELLQGFNLDVDLQDEGNGHPLLTGILVLVNLETTYL